MATRHWLPSLWNAAACSSTIICPIWMACNSWPRSEAGAWFYRQFLVTGHPSFALRRRVRQAGIRLVEKPLIGDGLTDVIRNSLEQDRGGE